MNRMLFVELLGGIGDLIFALPAIEALKQSHPNACLDVLTFAPGGELLVKDPRVDRVLFARRKGDLDAETLVRQDVADALASRYYDLIISDSRHSGIHELIEARATSRVVTQLWQGAGRDEPIASLFLRRLREERVIDPSADRPAARLFLSGDEYRAAIAVWAQLGVDPERVVVLNPHCGSAVKQWPLDHFVTLGRCLDNEGFTVALLAGDAPDLAWSIARLIPSARFVPRLSLRLTAACLAGAALVVSGDSGLAHLANVVGAPVLAIYGPTWAGRYGVAEPSIDLQTPFDCPERRPMNFTVQRCWYSGQCIYPGKLNCCEDVTPNDALNAAKKLLRLGPREEPRD